MLALSLTLAFGLEVAEIAGAGQLLDRHSILTRYPDAYAEGSPHEYYDDRTAREAQGAAAQIINWVERTTQGA